MRFKEAASCFEGLGLGIVLDISLLDDVWGNREEGVCWHIEVVATDRLDGQEDGNTDERCVGVVTFSLQPDARACPELESFLFLHCRACATCESNTARIRAGSREKLMSNGYG